MQSREFQEFLSGHDSVRNALQRASEAAPAKGFGPVTEMATLVLLFPLVRFILMEIGLPWLTTAKKYSELQRRRVEDWVDRKATTHGLDPDQVEAASRELVAELERTTGADARSQWEQLEKLLQSNSEE